MNSHFSPVLFVLLLLSWWDLVSARSASARPLKRLSHPSTHALDILPRRPRTDNDRRALVDPHSTTLRHTDSFRLTLSAFDQKFHLHLRPNEHLIHPSARINYYRPGPAGQSILTHSEPLRPQSVKAYWGEVVPAHNTAYRMREDVAGVVNRPAVDLGWARIVVHHQGNADMGISPLFEGAFSVDGVVHHISTTENYIRTKHPLDPDVHSDGSDATLVIWRDTDVMSALEEHALDTGLHPSASKICGHDSLHYNTNPLENPLIRKPPVATWYNPLDFYTPFGSDGFVKRDDVAGGGTGNNFVDSIGSSNGCPSTQKVIYMGVAADCVYTQNYGSTQNASTKIITNWNTASALYKTTFNVSLGIMELQVHDSACPTTVDPSTPWNVDCTGADLNDRLSLFSGWRGQKGSDGAGLWHLMSGCPTGTEVGIAWLGTLCQQTSSGQAPSIVSGTAVSTSGRTEWQVIAHEIGHNFGAIHDCDNTCNGTSPCCPLNPQTCDASAKFLMSPVAEAGEMNFSPCSLGNICSLMLGASGSKTNSTCLLDPDPNRTTITLQMCGNGIVEQGEDCDPGVGVNSTCCDSSTCKFRNGALCDPASSPCCTQQCTFASSTQVCRPSKDAQCDTAEMCTGNSSACPQDIVAPNGRSCGQGLACASGQCTSVAKQCQTVGASMNLTSACPSKGDTSCQVSCQDPTSSNRCIVLQSQLIDGSPCGFGGTCYSGNCQAANALDTAKAWYTQNLQISVPITVVTGVLVLALLWGLFRGLRRCCRRRETPVSLEPALSGVRGERLGSWPVVPGIDVSQPQMSHRRNQPSFQANTGPPQALQPGSSASFSRSPNVAYPSNPALVSRERSIASHRPNGSGGSYNGPMRQPFPTRPVRNNNTGRNADWVDERLYNGPR